VFKELLFLLALTATLGCLDSGAECGQAIITCPGDTKIQDSIGEDKAGRCIYPQFTCGKVEPLLPVLNATVHNLTFINVDTNQSCETTVCFERKTGKLTECIKCYNETKA